MSTKPPKPPNSVPEEDLSLHEDFAPIIAENGLIRQPKAPEVDVESLPAFLTRIDTLQDLVELRHAEQEERQKQAGQEEQQQVPQEAAPTENIPPNVVIESHPTEKPELNLEPTPVEDTSAQTQQPAQTSTHLPTVRQAQTTALAPVSKLTLARRITLLKRKRQHRRRLAARAKKRAAQAVAVPPKTPKSKKATAKNQTPKRPSRWKWALVILLLLFLGGISGLVPVERIPLLRDLAYAMGFDKNDTARMSFLRALLTWTDKTVGLPGNWSDEAGKNYLFARRGDAGTTGDTIQEDEPGLLSLNARLPREGGQTSLIDMQALNAMQRQKGYALDGVRGAVKLSPGQEEANLGPAAVRDDKVNVRTEANRDKGEVFFGSDNSAVNRAFKDGYDSSKTLASIKNPHIANGVPIDWLTNMTKRTMKTDTSIGGINKELNSTQVSWGSSVADMGDKKEHRDLYHAWITSRMSKYTPNLMLKKGLADSSFLGADIPVMASNVLNFSGIQVDIEAMNEDESAWKEYLEFEKNCREDLLNGGGRAVDSARDDFNVLFIENVKPGKTPPVNLDFPANCESIIGKDYSTSAFGAHIRTIQTACQNMRAGYNSLKNTCLMQVDTGSSRCDPNITAQYKSRYDSFKSYCEDYCARKKAEWEKQKHEDGETFDEEACKAERNVISTWDGNNAADTAQIVLAGVGGDADYFPQITKDQEYEENTQNVYTTIDRGLDESKVFFNNTK